MSPPYAYTPYIWPMLISAVFSAALGLYAWRHRAVPGAPAFAIQELCIALWALFTGVEMAATTLPTKVLYHKLEGWVALVGMGAVLCFALEHASAGRWATRRRVWTLSLLMAALTVLMLTNDRHHLLWTGFWFDRFVRVGRGPLNPLLMALALSLPVAALVVFFRLWRRSAGIYRRQAQLLAIGAALPVLTYLLEPLGINPLAPLDPVIIVWNVSSLLYAWAIFRFGLLEVVPLGRESAIERMANGLLVLDAQERIVDLNPAASALLALSRGAAIGRPAGQALSAHPDLTALFASKTTTSIATVLAGPDGGRHFQVQASPLAHPGGYPLGQLILLQDVTEQHRAEAQLIAQQRELAAQQERLSLARDLHDNLGQVFAFVSTQGQAAQRMLSQGDVAAADEYIGRLVEVAREADLDLRASILGLRATLSGQGLFPALAQYLVQYERRYGIHTELERPQDLTDGVFGPRVEAQLMRILQEALTNIGKHADAQRVQIGFALDDGWAQVTIQDDGRGFDPASALAAPGDHLGLRGMRERAEDLGGSFSVHSAPTQGAAVVVRVPVKGGDHA